MQDLEFMIINSNLQHSLEHVDELEKRVTFPVYQDTEEKNIWKLLRGGKDDIYIYDRCGRLAYLIPFPLSIMNSDERLVISAILATYIRSPCGTTCDKNATSLEDILNAKADFTDSDNEIFPMSESNQTTESLADLNAVPTNETVFEDVESFINGSNVHAMEDFSYLFFNNSSNMTSYNETDLSALNNTFNTLDRLFFRRESWNESVNDTKSTNVTFEVFTNNTDINFNNTVENNNSTEVNETVLYPEKEVVAPVKKKSGRCSEADTLECDHWSKRKLFRAHSCCAVTDESERTDSQRSLCRNYGRRRCKKLQTIIKCCIKTAWSTDGSRKFFEASVFKVNPSTTSKNADPPPVLKIDEKTPGDDIVCCKDDESGRKCRVLTTKKCSEGEFIMENVAPLEVAPTTRTD